MPDGSARVYVKPNPGTEAARRGAAFRITLPARNIRLVMETMPAALLAKETKLDEQSCFAETHTHR